jgi:hypothetical protein
VHGQLKLECWGWRCYLVVATAAPYRAMFDPRESQPKIVHEIPLLLNGNNNLLSSYVGKSVTATGKVQLEAVSPYYLNGIFLMTDSVSLPGGKTLQQAEFNPSPLSVTKYMASITLTPHRYVWGHRVWDPATSDTLSTQNLSGCSLSGGGDVMNCYCIEGYQATRIGSAAVGQKVTLEAVDEDFLKWGFGQTEVDEDAKKPMVVEVECTKENKK